VTSLLKTAAKQRHTLRDAWKKVRQEASEANVHELRVAARRILSCLSLIDSILLDSHRSKARRKIKRLMKKAGSLRDVQVQLAIAKSWPPAKAPAAFRAYLQRKHHENSRTVNAYLTAKRKRSIQQALKTAERRAQRGLDTLKPAITRSRLASALGAQRTEFHAARVAAKSQDPEKVHHFRVASKRLRYSLESVNPGLSEKPNAEYRSLRRYQKDLGTQRDLALINSTLREWRLNQHDDTARKTDKRTRTAG